MSAVHVPVFPRRLFAGVVATFLLGLAVDRMGGLAAQLVVSVWCWMLMFRLMRSSPDAWRLPFWVCLVWASAGEIFLSLVWGLYTYRLENIPFYIPPGHVFLLWMGMMLAPRVPRVFVVMVPAMAAMYGAWAFVHGIDTLSVLLIVLFLVCMMQAEGRRLYAVMFVVSLLVELYGTWMGNWVWHPVVPYSPLLSANPPLAAGAFYCLLDVLVGLTVRGLRRAWAGLPVAAPAGVARSAG